jgi:hypothetical protein
MGSMLVGDVAVLLCCTVVRQARRGSDLTSSMRTSGSGAYVGHTRRSESRCLAMAVT